jgi:hypothetical protein
MEKIKEDKKVLDKNYDENRALLLKEFNEKNVTEFIVEDGKDSEISAITYDSTQIIYDKEKLKEKLPKDILNKITRKEFSVDVNKLRELKSKIDKNILKQIINIEKVIDTSLLDYLYETEQLDPASLKGCFDLKKTTFVKVTRRKKKSK